MRHYNLALFAKLSWKFIHEEQIPWVTLLREKYLRGKNLLDIVAKPAVSTVWKCVCSGMRIIQQGSVMRIGDGTRVNVWQNTWA